MNFINLETFLLEGEAECYKTLSTKKLASIEGHVHRDLLRLLFHKFLILYHAQSLWNTVLKLIESAALNKN